MFSKTPNFCILVMDQCRAVEEAAFDKEENSHAGISGTGGGGEGGSGQEA